MPTPFDRRASSSAEKADASNVVPGSHQGASPSRRARLHSESLFGGANEIEIQHREAIYRLRITSLGKLILTK